MYAALEKIRTIREAVGVFNDADSLERAIDDLRTHGFARHEYTVLADTKTIEKKLGHIYRRVEDMEDNHYAPRTVFSTQDSIGELQAALFGDTLCLAVIATMAAVMASGGTLLTTAIAATAAGVGGGAIGNVLSRMVGKRHANYIQDQIQHGGLLLWVNTKDAAHEKRAVEILRKHSAHHVHVHEIPAN